MGHCTSKETKRVIDKIARSDELRSVVMKLYYDALLPDYEDGKPYDPMLERKTPKSQSRRLKKIKKHFITSKYIDDIIYKS